MANNDEGTKFIVGNAYRAKDGEAYVWTGVMWGDKYVMPRFVHIDAGYEVVEKEREGGDITE